MPTVWLSLKKSLHCRSDPQDVEQPQSIRNGSSRSMVNQFKDVFRGSKRSMHNGSCSPCSVASSEFMNNNMSQEAMILRTHTGSEMNSMNDSFRQRKSSMVGRTGVMRPKTYGAVFLSPANYCSQSVVLSRKVITTPLIHACEGESLNEACMCLKCNQRFANTRTGSLQSLHLKSPAVKVLKEGDATRNVVEIIFKSSWLESGIECGKIERVFKVNHTHTTLGRFEEYRETVKTKASKLPKKHPRCLADGNEVLSFLGTAIMCSLGTNGQSTLCDFLGCNVCNIIRTGFPTKEVKERGIYTTATSLRAHNSINLCEEGLIFPVKRAIMVCRVIAGRVHKPLSANNSHDSFSIPSGFDSVAGEVGNCSKLDELYVSNPRGVLPCFFVVYT